VPAVAVPSLVDHATVVCTALRKDELYPSLGPIPNYIIAAVYCGFSVTVSVYMFVEKPRWWAPWGSRR